MELDGSIIVSSDCSYSASCLECQRLWARWEAVGAAGRGRGLLAARADRAGAAAATARRFGVTKDPTFLL